MERVACGMFLKMNILKMYWGLCIPTDPFLFVVVSIYKSCPRTLECHICSMRSLCHSPRHSCSKSALAAFLELGDMKKTYKNFFFVFRKRIVHVPNKGKNSGENIKDD